MRFASPSGDEAEAERPAPDDVVVLVARARLDHEVRARMRREPRADLGSEGEDELLRGAGLDAEDLTTEAAVPHVDARGQDAGIAPRRGRRR